MSALEPTRSSSEIRLLEPATPSYRASESLAQLVTALAAAQATFAPIEKACVATVASKREGVRSFSYKYASLADVLQRVRPELARNGLAVLQMATVSRGAVVVTTMLAHTSGEWIETRLALGLESTDPQAIGSAITYARRYALCALVGVAPGDPDDDGAAAMPAAPREAVADHRPSTTTTSADSVPEGFEAWWASLEVAASAGLPALESAWGKASGAHKAHATTVHREAWQALKTHAQHRHGYNGRTR